MCDALAICWAAAGLQLPAEKVQMNKDKDCHSTHLLVGWWQIADKLVSPVHVKVPAIRCDQVQRHMVRLQ